MYRVDERGLRMEDVEVEFHFYEERELFDGYRPAHQVTEDYLTTGLHRYKHAGSVCKDDIGSITFISPEYYPKSLWVGKEIVFYDGAKPKGYAVVTRILNKTLEDKNAGKFLIHWKLAPDMKKEDYYQDGCLYGFFEMQVGEHKAGGMPEKIVPGLELTEELIHWFDGLSHALAALESGEEYVFHFLDWSRVNLRFRLFHESHVIVEELYKEDSNKVIWKAEEYKDTCFDQLLWKEVIALDTFRSEVKSNMDAFCKESGIPDLWERSHVVPNRRKEILDARNTEIPASGEYLEKIYDTDVIGNTGDWCWVRFEDTDGEEWYGSFRGLFKTVEVSKKYGAAVVVTDSYVYAIDSCTRELIDYNSEISLQFLTKTPLGDILGIVWGELFVLNGKSSNAFRKIEIPVPIHDLEFAIYDKLTLEMLGANYKTPDVVYDIYLDCETLEITDWDSREYPTPSPKNTPKKKTLQDALWFVGTLFVRWIRGY